MPRRSITKEHAEKIVDKLGATVVTSGRAHDRAEFYYKGVLIASFGIRRSSRKDIGHDFLPADLYLSHRQTLDLANCPLSYEDYVEILKDKGYIQEAGQPALN
jgi:hypothetical protein